MSICKRIWGAVMVPKQLQVARFKQFSYHAANKQWYLSKQLTLRQQTHIRSVDYIWLYKFPSHFQLQAKPFREGTKNVSGNNYNIPVTIFTLSNQY